MANARPGCPGFHVPVSYTHLDVYKRQVKIARDGVADEEQGFLEPLADLVARRVTLADLAERSERA